VEIKELCGLWWRSAKSARRIVAILSEALRDMAGEAIRFRVFRRFHDYG